MTKMKVLLFIRVLSVLVLLTPQALADDYKGKASDIRAKTSSFNGVLSTNENTVQKALDEIDDVTCTAISGCVPNAITASSSAALSNKYFTDNVGVGTHAPTSKIHVHGGGIKGELVNKGWEVIPMDQTMNPSGVTFSEVNSMTVMDGKLYIGYDIDGSSGVIRSPVYSWDGNTLTFLSNLGGGTGALYNGAAFLIEYKGLLYGGLQSNAVGGGDVYVSSDKGLNWTKSFENTETHFAYSAAVFKGNLYVGLGYSNGHIYRFDGTTWTKVYDGSGVTGLVVSLHVSRGRIFAATGNTNEMILSSADGTSWTVEETSASTYTEINHFIDFKGKLFANVMGGSNNILVRDDATGTWSIAYLDLPGNQCWGMNVYNDVLYVGCSQSPDGAIIFKSKDGYTFEEDIQFNTLGTSYEYEAFKMINYNGSMYVGVGGDGRYSANLWRKTDSLGQLFDTDHKIVRQFTFNTNGTNWGDMSQLETTTPVSFGANISIGTNNIGTGKLNVTGGNVGIGSTKPERPLDVKTSGVNVARFTSTSASGTGPGTANFRIGTDDGAALSTGDKFVTLDFFGSANSSGLHGSSAGITAYAASDWSASNYHSRMDFETTNSGSTVRNWRMSLSNGNLGIGTQQPSEKLHVVGNARVSGLVSCDTIDTDSNGVLSCGTDDGGSGGVGIGTANTITFWPTTNTIGSLPTATYPSLTELSYVKGTTSAIQTQLDSKDAVTTAGDFITRTANDFDVDALDEDDMVSNSAAHLATQQSIKAYVDNAISGVSGGDGGWIDGGTNVYTAVTTDNVGIGTTTPNAATLEIVKNAAQPPLKISGSATGNGNFLTVTSAGAVGIGTTNPTALNANWLVGLYSSSNGNRAMAVQNPNTGTSAQARFEVKTSDANGFIGNVPTNFSGSSTWAGRTMLMAEAGNGLALVAGSGAGDIDFLTSSTTRAMRISGSSMAMGTTTPTGRMDIRGDEVRIWTGAGTNTNATSSGELYVEGDLEVDGTIYGIGAGLTSLDDDAVGFDDANSDFSATTIGAAVEELVSVNGSGPNATDAKVDWSQLGNVPAGFADGTDDGAGGGSGTVNSGVTGAFSKYVGSTTVDDSAVLYEGDGKIGIGTTGPTQALQVVGTISATAFVGDGSGLTSIGASALTTDSVSADELNATGVEAELEAVMDLQDMQGAVTDAQVPNAITVDLATTATTANAGDSATAFFSSGAIERERGGTAADTSAYGAGLLGSDGSNNTIDVDTIAEIETAIGGATNILTETEIDASSELAALMDDETGTGALVFAGGDIGAATATTPAENDNDTSVATTAYVQTEISGLGSGPWADGGTNIYASPTTDNVAIGTTTPTAQLLVENLTTGDSFRVNDVSLDGTPFIINSAGNVGIGTTTPGAALQVGSGTALQITSTGISYAGSSTIVAVNGSATQVTGNGFVGSAGGTAGTTFSCTGNSLTSGTCFGATSSSNSFTGNLFSSTYSGTGSGRAGNFVITDSSATGAALRASTAGTGPAFITGTGSVGIGTANPQTLLQVAGDTKIGNGTFNNTSANEDLYVEGNLEVDGTLYGDGSGLTNLPSTSGGWSDGGANVYTSTTTDTVGIGTTGASATLEVVKQSGTKPFMISATATGDGDYLIINSSGVVGIGTTSPRGTTTGTLDLGPTGTLYTQTITGPTGPTILGTGGNVGIGTITAGSLVTIGSTGQASFTSAGVATLPTPNLTGKIDINNTSVSDDDCSGEQGLFWYDSTDSAFEFCKANSGIPFRLGQPTPPAQQVIAAGNTITADACGTIKDIGADGAVTTSTTNTFTAPTSDLNGCCMYVVNTSANAITLDNNSLFYSAGAADVVLGTADSAIVCTNGTVWAQMGGSNN